MLDTKTVRLDVSSSADGDERRRATVSGTNFNFDYVFGPNASQVLSCCTPLVVPIKPVLMLMCEYGGESTTGGGVCPFSIASSRRGHERFQLHHLRVWANGIRCAFVLICGYMYLSSYRACVVICVRLTLTGKTFTMMGVPGDRRQAGIIPRLATALFDHIEQSDEQIEFTVWLVASSRCRSPSSLTNNVCFV
mgnify:CR=1 FL=1